MQESEIKNIITEDENSVENFQSSAEKPKRVSFDKVNQIDKQLTQLKQRNLVKPYMEEQQKKLGFNFNQ